MALPRSEDFRSTYFEEDTAIVAPYTTVVIKPSPSSQLLKHSRAADAAGLGFDSKEPEHPRVSKVRGAHAESRRKMSLKIDPKILESPDKKTRASILTGSTGPTQSKGYRPPQTRANLICPPQKGPPTDDCLELGSGEVIVGKPQTATKITEQLVRKYTNDRTLKVYDVEVVKGQNLQHDLSRASPDKKRGLLSDTSIASSVDEEQVFDFQRKASSKLRLGPKTPLPQPQNKYTKHVPPPSLERLEPTYGRKYW